VAQRRGAIDQRLATTLALLECATIGPADTPQRLVCDAVRAGVAAHALMSAAYINFGFNVINRVADSLGAALPDRAKVGLAAALLLRIGYWPLSGFHMRTPAVIARGHDPFAPLVGDLRRTLLRAPGSLSPAVRETIYSGVADGPLGDFGRVVAERAPAITHAHIDALRRDGYSDDHIFEATTCASVGAATWRLDRLLAAFSPSVQAEPP
jgi:hypothetical protein